MGYLGQIQNNCQEDNVYTAIGDCNKKKARIVALLVTGHNALFPIEKAAFLSALPGYVTTEGPLKVTPINEIIANTPTGGDVNVPEAGFSGPTPSNLNAFSVIYQVDGGDCLLKELMKLNKRKVRVFEIDNDGYIYGTVVQKGDQSFFAGFSSKLFTNFTPTDGTTLAAINFGVWYSANYENEMKNMNAFELDEIPTGLTGVMLQKGATTGTAKVIGTCDAEDYTSLYGADWEPTMFVNAAGANPTTVVYNATAGLLTFSPIAPYKVASASVLAGGDIVGLDGVNTLVDLT